MLKHVLITGAGGFIGHHLLECVLLKSDWNVTATDSFRHRGVTSRITEVFKRDATWRDRVHVITHDLTTPWADSTIYNIQERYGDIDTIFNIASESHVDRSITEPYHFAHNNVKLMIEMLELARMIKPRVFLHLSTDEVYGATPLGAPSKEWDPILPSNPYSASKAAQEAFGISYWRTYGVPLVIANCMNVFGERQDPEKFVPKAVGHMIADEQIPIYCTNHVPGRRHWLHARNLADALCFLSSYPPAEYASKYVFPSRYNVVGTHEVDNLHMVTAIGNMLKMTPRVQMVDAETLRPGHDAQYALDGAKLSEMGWEPPIDFWYSLERTVRWMVDRPEWLKVSAPA